MVKEKERGSITIFGILVLVLTVECLLVLSEGARFCAINRSAHLQSQSAIESVFASYCSLLWQEYHLLSCDHSQMESLLITYGDERTSPEEWRENLIGYSLEDIHINSYTLITDGSGNAFKGLVSNYMKDNILYEAAKAIYGQYEAVFHLLETDNSDMGKVEEALEILETGNGENNRSPYQLNRGGSAEQTEDLPQISDTSINPMEEYKRLKNTEQLELLIEDTSKISKKSFDKTQAVSERELLQGKNYLKEEGNWIDRILLQQYLLTYLSSYAEVKENHGLAYEIEYLIGGQDSDVENLKKITDDILLIRLAANMLYVFSDSVKVEEANALALALTTAVALPELYEVVGVAILMVWAYGESLLDVRGLLQGKKIPLLKSSETWTLQLTGITELATGHLSVKESETGLSYVNYLGIMLLMMPDETLAMRAMDMQEATIRSISGEKDFNMDTLMIQAEVTMSYRYNSIFTGARTGDYQYIWQDRIKHKINYQYGT